MDKIGAYVEAQRSIEVRPKDGSGVVCYVLVRNSVIGKGELPLERHLGSIMLTQTQALGCVRQEARSIIQASIFH